MDFGGIPTSPCDGSEYMFVRELFSSKLGSSRQIITWGVFLGVSYFVRGVNLTIVWVGFHFFAYTDGIFSRFK